MTSGFQTFPNFVQCRSSFSADKLNMKTKQKQKQNKQTNKKTNKQKIKDKTRHTTCAVRFILTVIPLLRIWEMETNEKYIAFFNPYQTDVFFATYLYQRGTSPHRFSATRVI